MIEARETSAWETYGDSKFEFRVGDAQVIIPIQERRCPRGHVFKLANGEIVVAGAEAGVDCPPDKFLVPMPPGQTSRKKSWRRSFDNGETWYETPTWPTINTHQFPDGEIILISQYWAKEIPDCDDAYSLRLYRSADNGLTFGKREEALLFGMPELAHPTKHSDDKTNYNTQMHGRIIGLHDGSLLASLGGIFKNDIKERVSVARSTDRGMTWNYLSTVAFDLTKGVRPRPLGFDEPTLLLLPNGEILCFMRSGNRRGGALYMSRSNDNGKSWSHADPIADRGVEPMACLMENGIIAVVYGRPGNWLTFSLDYGETWVEHFCFDQGIEPGDCGNYNGMVEIAPDTLLVVYSKTHPDDAHKNAIMGRRITVRPGKKVREYSKKLYAFDRDQTVETSEGPIPLGLIRKLVKEGAVVYAVGNVLLCNEANIPYTEGETKVERVRNLRKKYPDLDEYILIDDGEIEVQGFKHYTPDEFLKTLK